MALTFNQEPKDGTVLDCVESALEAWGSICDDFYVYDGAKEEPLTVVHRGRRYKVLLEPI